MSRHRSIALSLLCLLIVAHDAAHAQAPRKFAMGFTPFPHDFSAEAVQEMRQFIRGNADLLAIHLEGVPWPEALAGSPFHPKFQQEWDDKLKALPPGAKIYVALSPLNNGRNALAGYRADKENLPLPAEFRSAKLDDEIVKKAYLAYCRRAIQQFKPDYLGVGIEANELYHHSPSQWPRYAALHRHVYSELKKEHPKLQVFTSFTLHNMLNPGWKDRVKMLEAFKDLMDHNDAVAVSFYPFMGGLSDQIDASLTWLDKEFSSFKKPFAVAEMGHIAQPMNLPTYKVSVNGDEKGQAAFHEKMLAFADTHDTAFVVSFLYRDYDALWERIKAFSPEAFLAWRDCGLLDESGRQRPAYDVWRRYFERGK